MALTLPPLPFAREALEPHMSRETLDFHYGKHHKTYVDTANKLMAGTEFEDMTLDDIVRKSSGKLFNNAAQVWNHDFYWKSMKPKGGGEPTGALADAIKRDFASFNDFKTQFQTAAVGQFGSGWAWLVNEGGKLKIVTTGNAETPMTKGATCLLTCDVWEHAYYIDYRNLRAKYFETWLANLVNWDFAAANFK